MAVNKEEVVFGNLDHYVRAVENGDMLWTHAWYEGQKRLVDALYGKAAQSAPFQITVAAKGILLGEERLENPEALRRALAARLTGHPPLRQRRAFVRHAPEVTPAQLNAVLDAIAAADGIIAWTQPIDEAK
jgi:predicted N-acyltransferase